VSPIVLFAERKGDRTRGREVAQGAGLQPRRPPFLPQDVVFRGRSRLWEVALLGCDARVMPLGVVVTGANANDGCQTEAVLHALVGQPPLLEPQGIKNKGGSCV